MNLKNLIVVVLRLMALNFLLLMAIELTPRLLNIFGLSEHDAPGMAILLWIVPGALVLSAVLLWMLALPIARLVTRGVDQDLSFGTMSLTDCYTIVFVGVGLMYITSHLPQVLNWGHYVLKAAATNAGTSWRQQVDLYQVSQAFIPFIVGVVLFVNGRSWAAVLARKHQNAETPTQTPE